MASVSSRIDPKNWSQTFGTDAFAIILQEDKVRKGEK